MAWDDEIVVYNDMLRRVSGIEWDGEEAGHPELKTTPAEESIKEKFAPVARKPDDSDDLPPGKKALSEKQMHEIRRRHDVYRRASRSIASLIAGAARKKTGLIRLEWYIPALKPDKRDVERGFADLGAAVEAIMTPGLVSAGRNCPPRVYSALIAACARMAAAERLPAGSMGNIEAAERWMWEDPTLQRPAKGEMDVAVYALALDAMGADVPGAVIEAAKAMKKDRSDIILPVAMHAHARRMFVLE